MAGAPPQNEDVRAFGRQCERALAQVLRAEGVGGQFLPGYQAPALLVFPFIVRPPSAGALRKIQGLAPAFEHVLQRPVRVAVEPGVIRLEVLSPWRLAPRAAILPPGRGLRVPLGLGAARGHSAPVYVDFARADQCHILISGGTGTGKTESAKAILYHLARQNPPGLVRCVILSRTAGRWGRLAGLRHVMALIQDYQEAASGIAWVQEQMRARLGSGRTLPALFLMADDLHDLLEKVPAVAAPLGDLAGMARQTGIHLVAITQRAGESGDMMVRANAGLRLVFRSADAGEAARNTGRRDSGAERLAWPGDGLLLAGGEDVERVAICPVADQDVSPAWLGDLREAPWRPTVATVVALAPPGQAQGLPAASGPTVPTVLPTDADLQRSLRTPRRRAPATAAEYAYVRRVYERHGRKASPTCREVWGSKDPTTWALLAACLSAPS